MPELPEVEHVARSLDRLLRGRIIVSAELRRPRLAPDTTPDEFARLLRSRAINFVHRRGKHVLFDLSSELTLIVHLRMSGRFSLVTAETEEPKFTHAAFELDGGDRLLFDDQRHFGLMKIVPTAALFEAKELLKLAPEPFSEEFTAEYLYRTARQSRRPLKEFLLDQTKVCGLGNIYAAEAMFAASLTPRRMAAKLTKARAELLHASIKAVLEMAISHPSTTKVNPADIEGEYFSASTNSEWHVYDRENKPCRHCKTPIVRLKQSGRSTYYCPTCQRQ